MSSNINEQSAEKQASLLPGLTQAETETLKKVFSSPLDIPAEWKAWLISWLEANPPQIPISQVLGFTQASTPVGSIFAYAGFSAPDAFLLCDGSAISRTIYAPLFSAIGTAYGVGDGSTTFNLPDLRGRVPTGKGTNATVNALGNNDGVAVGNRRPKHRHTPHSHYIPSVTRGVVDGTNDAWQSNADGPSVGVFAQASDGGSGVGTDSLDAPAYVVVNFIIKI